MTVTSFKSNKQMFQAHPSILPIVFGISGLLAVGMAGYWIFNKTARRRQLEELRRTYENMGPTDPQYNTARALYTAASISDSSDRNYSGTGSNSGGDNGSDDA